MSPDPFRALDGVEPPDQWDEIAERAARHGPRVDLAAPPRRTRALLAAAAVLALVGGGVALATTRGGDRGTDVAAGPTTEGAGGPDPCEFALDSTADVPLLEPGRLEHAPTHGTGPVAGARRGHGDGGPVEVDVRAGRADPDLASGDLAVTSGTERQERRWVTYALPVPAPRPGCESVVITYEELDDRPPSDRKAEVDRIAAAVRLIDVAARAQGCQVTFDDADLPPFTPKADGEEAPFEVLSDLTDSWLRAEVGDALVLVGAGTPEDGDLQPVGTRWVSTEADYDTGAARAKVDAYVGLAEDGPCVGAAVHVVFPLTDAEVEGIEAGTITQPDITAATAVAVRVLDAFVVAGAGTASRTERPTETTRAAEATPLPEADRDDVEGTLPDGRRWLGTITPDEVCVRVEGDDAQSCGSRPGGRGASILTIDLGTPEESLLVHGARPAGATDTYLRDGEGGRVDAPVVVSPDGSWFVAFFPAPFVELDLSGGHPVVHLDASGAEIPSP